MQVALDTWLEQCKKLVAQQNDSALFLTKRGIRLATRTIDDAVCQLEQDARWELFAHILRHTCLTHLVFNRNDQVLFS